MSNKRIQKKHNKQKLVREILNLSYTETPESLYALRQTIQIMQKMTMPALIQLGRDIVRAWTIRNSPLRPMLPRSSFAAGDLVQWRPIISQF